MLETALNQHTPLAPPPPRRGGFFSSFRGRGGAPSTSSRPSRPPPQRTPGSFAPQQYYAPQHQYPQPQYIPRPHYHARGHRAPAGPPRVQYAPPQPSHPCVVCNIKDISICLISNHNPRFARPALAMANTLHVEQNVQKNYLQMAHRTRTCVM